MPIFYAIGVKSVSVVAITGTFIGMVLAVQAYHQFAMMGLATRLGSVINISIVRELGPVLAATMLAGRVGSAMAAELGTMRVTEQIDALSALGTNPIYYLVVPRFLACVLLIPLLTLMGDFMGVIGGAVVSTQILNVDSFAYWKHTRDFVDSLDIFAGVFKSYFFGAAIALISCHRGFNSKAGAEGVGRAATEAFVFSFIAILFLDFVLGLGWNNVYRCDLAPGARTVMNQGGATDGATARRPDRAARREHAVPLPGGPARHRPGDPPRRDGLHHRRERLRQDGDAQADHRPLAARRAGSVWFDGRDVAELDGKELVKMRLRFGFLFQMAALFDSLTVFDNVAFGLREHHICDEDEVRQIVAERLQEVGLPAGIEQKKPAELSGGQRKRVGPGPGAGDRPGGHALRRADHRARPDHERRDQRADPPDPADQEDDRRGGHPRHEDRDQGRRPGGDALSRWPGSSPASRRSSTTARPRAWRSRPTRGSASSSAARPASGSARWPMQRSRRFGRPRGPELAPERARTAKTRVNMNERVMQFRIGMFVIVAGLVLTMMIVWFGESPSLLRDQVYLKVRYAEAPGVLEGVPVRKSGIRIGEVFAIAFDERPNQPDGVLVTLALERRYKLHEGTVPRLTRSLIGDVTIDMHARHRPRSFSRPARRPPDAPSSRARSRPTRPRPWPPPPRRSRRPATRSSRSTRPPRASPRSPRAPTSSTTS